jgi:hypothetical protein
VTITPTLASYTGFEEDLPPPFFGAEPNGLEDAIQAANDDAHAKKVKKTYSCSFWKRLPGNAAAYIGPQLGQLGVNALDKIELSLIGFDNAIISTEKLALDRLRKKRTYSEYKTGGFTDDQIPDHTVRYMNQFWFTKSQIVPQKPPRIFKKVDKKTCFMCENEPDPNLVSSPCGKCNGFVCSKCLLKYIAGEVGKYYLHS